MEINNLFAPLVGFQSRKAAQIAAYFTVKAGGRVEKLKLIKLIYLSERESMSRHGHPMIYDEFYSLKDGPIASAALNGINGVTDPDVWDKYIARNGNVVVAVKAVVRDDLAELSNAEIRVLDQVWADFGGMTPSQVRNWTHAHCPEYTEVTGGRLPISYMDVFKALGEDNVDQRVADVKEFRNAERLLG